MLSAWYVSFSQGLLLEFANINTHTEGQRGAFPQYCFIKGDNNTHASMQIDFLL
jgi:hypothetical protein